MEAAVLIRNLLAVELELSVRCGTGAASCGGDGAAVEPIQPWHVAGGELHHMVGGRAVPAAPRGPPHCRRHVHVQRHAHLPCANRRRARRGWASAAADGAIALLSLNWFQHRGAGRVLEVEAAGWTHMAEVQSAGSSRWNRRRCDGEGAMEVGLTRSQ